MADRAAASSDIATRLGALVLYAGMADFLELDRGKPLVAVSARRPSANERRVNAMAPDGLAIPRSLLRISWVLVAPNREVGDRLVSNVRDEVICEGKTFYETDCCRVMQRYISTCRRITIITPVGGMIPNDWRRYDIPDEFLSKIGSMASENCPVNAVYECVSP